MKEERYDLTKLFGSGNEPATLEEFLSYFPADHYIYNSEKQNIYVDVPKNR